MGRSVAVGAFLLACAFAASACGDADATGDTTPPPPPPVDPCPQIALAGPGFKSVSADTRIAMALRKNGTVVCWGNQSSGDECLGELNGTTDWYYEPVESLGLSCVIALVMSDEYGTALTARGEGLLWSQNAGGDLNPTEPWPNDAGMPIRKVVGLGKLEMIRTALRGAAAVNEAGDLYRWGFLWNRIEEPELLEVPGIITSFDVGLSHLCAVNDAHEVWCVGENGWGVVGDGTQIDRAQPVQVLGLPDASAVAVSGSHTCAITTDGAVWCWGWDRGGFGRGVVPGSDDFILQPIPSTPFPPAVMLDLDPASGCAVTVHQDLYCWGKNWYERFDPDPDVELLTEPTLVPGAGKILEVALGIMHVCVLRVDGTIWCAGEPTYLGSVRAPGDTSWGPIAAQ